MFHWAVDIVWFLWQSIAVRYVMWYLYNSKTYLSRAAAHRGSRRRRGRARLAPCTAFAEFNHRNASEYCCNSYHDDLWRRIQVVLFCSGILPHKILVDFSFWQAKGDDRCHFDINQVFLFFYWTAAFVV